MPANFSRLDILLGGDASGAITAIETAEQRFERFKYKVAQGNLDKPSGGGLREKAGGLAVATAGVYAFQKVAEAATNAATAIRTGASEATVMSEAVNKIPIVGQLKQAGEAIYELIHGEKAAVIEAINLGDAAERVSNAFHSMALARQSFGKRGDDKSSAEATAGHDAERSAIGKRVEESDKAIAAFEAEHAASSFWHPVDRIQQSFNLNKSRGVGDYSATEKAEYAGLNATRKLNESEKAQADLKFAESEKLRKQDIAQRQLETFRAMMEQRIATETTDEIKALRRRGLTIESALLAIDAHTEADTRSRYAKLDKAKLDALEGGANGAAAKALRDQVNAEERAAAQSADGNRFGLEQEAFRKRYEITLGNEEKIAHITAEGNIERLKLAHQDGEAELATIRETARQAIVEAEKKQRGERRSLVADRSDPELAGEKSAIAEKLRLSESLARDKNKTTQAEKQIDIEQKLSRLKIDSLKSQADDGDFNARREAEQLEVQEKYKVKMLEILKLEQDRNTTAAQRAELFGLMLAAGDTEKNQLAKLSQGNEDFKGATAKFENSSHLSGLAQASREGSEPKQIAKATTEGAKTSALILDAINKLIDVTKPGNNFTLPTF